MEDALYQRAADHISLHMAVPIAQGIKCRFSAGLFATKNQSKNNAIEEVMEIIRYLSMFGFIVISLVSDDHSANKAVRKLISTHNAYLDKNLLKDQEIVIKVMH